VSRSSERSEEEILRCAQNDKGRRACKDSMVLLGLPWAGAGAPAYPAKAPREGSGFMENAAHIHRLRRQHFY